MVRADQNDADLQDQGRQVEGGRHRDRAAARDRPADPRRNDLRRDLGDARRRAEASRASTTSCSTPSPSTPSARARRSPRPAAGARSRSPPTWRAAAWTSSSAGSPEGMAQAELRKLGLSPTDESYEEELNALVEQFESQIEARGGRGARARRALHRRNRAPRVSPDRQPAARPLRPSGRPGRVPLLPLRRGRPDPSVRRRPDLQDPRPPRPGQRGGRGGAARGEDAHADRSRTRRRRSRSRTS